MADHNENALHAAIKALNQVVAPSVDRSNPLAVEQLRLVSMYLEFHVQHRSHERKLAWTNLHLQARLAQEAGKLLATVLPDGSARLIAAAQAAQRQLGDTGAPATVWERMHGELGQCISEVQAEANACDESDRNALDTLVLAHAREHLELHRVWFKSFGFEGRPESLPSLEAVLAQAPDI
ncbi:MAG: hypothetical protein V4609_09985 [Pseudomonadota bacterium]